MSFLLEEKTRQENAVAWAIVAGVCALFVTVVVFGASKEFAHHDIEETSEGFYIGNPPADKATETFFGKF